MRYQDMLLPIGSNLKLNVSVEGEPDPHVTWYKDGAMLSGRGHAMVDTFDYGTTISVHRLGRDDGGEYHVVAKNEWGMAEARFNVRVMGKRAFISGLISIGIDQISFNSRLMMLQAFGLVGWGYLVQPIGMVGSCEATVSLTESFLLCWKSDNLNESNIILTPPERFL